MSVLSLTSVELTIDADTTVLDRGLVPTAILRVRPGAMLRYVFIGAGDGVFDRRFVLEEGSRLHGGAVVYAPSITYTAMTEIVGDRVRSDLSILALAQSGSRIDVRGNSLVEKPYRHIHTRVDQTNILLGSDVRVRGIPTLEIATDDVDGGHSCRVHRIAPEALFFLQSRGLDGETAEGLLIDGELRRHTSVIGDCELCDMLVGEIREVLFPPQ